MFATRPAFLLLYFFMAACSAAGGTIPSTSTPSLGVYSDMEYNEEGGDVLGVEIWLIHAASGYVVVFQSSEGSPSAPVVAAATIEGDLLRFVVPAGNSYSGSTFTGRVKAGHLVGSFSEGRLAPDGNSQLNLTRGLSYWQR